MSASPKKPADYHQRTEALNLQHSVLVSAPAGSGKTEILTQRYLRALMTVERPERILAITFTLKSAAEMKNRIMTTLEKAARPEPAEDSYEHAAWTLANQVLRHSNQHEWNILDNSNRLRIQTIDSLHAFLMMQLPLLSGFGGTPRIEEDANRLYTLAALNLLRELDDDDTDPEDIQAISHLLELAGNRTERLMPRLCSLLAYRDQWLDALNEADPMHMEQALRTFVRTTLQLASKTLFAFKPEELIKAISEASGYADTLAWAADLDKMPRASIDNLKIWRKLADFLTTQRGELRKKVTRRDGFPPKTAFTVSVNAWLKSVDESGEASELENLLNRVRNLPEVTYPVRAQEFREHLVRALTRLVGHLQVIFTQENTMDFVEVSRRALSALIDGEGASEVLLRLDYQIQHILVDEQQDTALPQIRLLEALTEGWSEGDGRTLFMVGDAQQSIYQFRQADVRLFNQLWESKRLGNIPLQTIKLTENFRSDPALVEWVNETMEIITPKSVDHYVGSVTFSPSIPFKTDESGHVSVHPLVGGNDNDEADEVVSIIQSTLTTYPENKIVVLVRARTHLQWIINALQANKIPYSATKIDPLADRPQVKDALALIKALWHPMDRLSWVGLLRSAVVGMTWQDILSICDAAGQGSVLSGLYAVLDSRLLSEDGICRAHRLVSAIRTHSISGELSGDEDLPNHVRSAWYSLGGAMITTPTAYKDVMTLFDRLDAHCENGLIMDMANFAESINRLYATAEPGEVELMTIHNAKGLEFDTVILPGLHKSTRGGDTELLEFKAMPEGFLAAPNPGYWAEVDTAEARLYRSIRELKAATVRHEQKRLLYVALTRAKRTLHLLGCIKPGGKPPANSLLNDLWPALSKDFENADVITGSSHSNTDPQCLGEIPRVDRVPANYKVHAPSVVFMPKYQRTSIFSVTHEDENDNILSDERIEARIRGILFHALAERITREGIGKWDYHRFTDAESALVAMGIRLGLAEPRAHSATESALRMARRMIKSSTGKQLLSPKGEVELAITGSINGRWVNGQIDRYIPFENHILLIDYKTSGIGLTEFDTDTFLLAENKKYEQQLADYAALLKLESDEKRPIFKALYFPALDILHFSGAQPDENIWQ